MYILHMPLLSRLYDHIISCLEDEAGGRLVIAALCLLECSRFGLQESELLDMLGALTPIGFSSDEEEEEAANVTPYDGQSVPSSAQHNHSRLPSGQSSPHLQQPHSREPSPSPHSGSDILLTTAAAATGGNTAPADMLAVSGYAASNKPRPESSLYTPSSQASRSHRLSPQGGRAASHSTVADLDEYSDQELAKLPVRPSSHSLEPPPTRSRSLSPSYVLLPGATEAMITSHEVKLSPASAKRHHTHSDAAPNPPHQLPVVPGASPEGTPNMRSLKRPKHKLPPSPSLSLLSAELAHVMRSRKVSSSSQGNDSEEAEIQEITPAAGSSSNQHSPFNRSASRTRLTAGVGLERMGVIHFMEAKQAPKLASYQFATLFHRLRPFLRSVGRPGECRWAIGSKAFSQAIRRKYFKHPPTHSFPFSFCTSPLFYGADRDQSLYPTTPNIAAVNTTQKQTPHNVPSPVQGYGTTSRSGSSMHGGASIVHKRFDWWHARLAGYFSVCSNEGRRAEELPYHLARTQHCGRLAHCLVHFPVFELLSTPECVSQTSTTY